MFKIVTMFCVIISVILVFRSCKDDIKSLFRILAAKKAGATSEELQAMYEKEMFELQQKNLETKAKKAGLSLKKKSTCTDLRREAPADETKNDQGNGTVSEMWE